MKGLRAGFGFGHRILTINAACDLSVIYLASVCNIPSETRSLSAPNQRLVLRVKILKQQEAKTLKRIESK